VGVEGGLVVPVLKEGEHARVFHRLMENVQAAAGLPPRRPHHFVGERLEPLDALGVNRVLGDNRDHTIHLWRVFRASRKPRFTFSSVPNLRSPCPHARR